jgi:hypothetical protein
VLVVVVVVLDVVVLDVVVLDVVVVVDVVVLVEVVVLDVVVLLEVVVLVEVVVVLLDVVVVRLLLVVVDTVLLVVLPGRAGWHGLSVVQRSVVPTREIAPGPGRSLAASTVGSKVGGKAKRPTRVVDAEPPRRLMALPNAVIVRTGLPFGPNAPLLRCSQLSKTPLQAVPTAMPFSQHCFAGSWNSPKKPSASRQNPAKMRL